MKTLKDKVSQLLGDFTKGAEEQDENVNVIVDFITLDEAVNGMSSGMILEGKDFFRKIPGTTYTYRIDKPRATPGPGNMKHIHLYSKDGRQVFAMNIDGTAHDGSHQIEIPDEVVSFLRSKGFIIPVNNLIEWIEFDTSSGRQLLLD